MASKTIIVTGATKGLGLAIAEFILTQPEKHKLLATGRDKAALEKLKSRFTGRVEIVAGDLGSDLDLPCRALTAAKSSFGRLDGLIVNHGTLGDVHKIADTDPVKWQKTFDINVISAVAFVQAAIPELRQTKGCILFTSTGASVRGMHSWGAYGASKACLNHLAMTLQVEEPEITTLSIRPGQIDTEMQRELRETHKGVMDPKDWEAFSNAYKEGKLLRPEQPGNVMARLVLNPPYELNGRFINWNDDLLKQYQDL